MISIKAKSTQTERSVALLTQIPTEILNDQSLNDAIKLLPPNYNFEIHKSIWKLKANKVKRVALQFPEGLLIYSLVISDILKRFGSSDPLHPLDTVILGDVTYGACCIDDRTASFVGCDFMIHYGHSCLVPVDCCLIKILYVFVDIAFDPSHLISTIKHNFSPDSSIALMGTVQFLSTLNLVRQSLSNDYKYTKITVPQERPLSPGEVLGCTSPRLPTSVFDAVIYVADGRFHLEAIMIANPTVPAYKYDPYSKAMSREHYSHSEMHGLRQQAILQAQKTGRCFGIIVGTLGRQSNRNVVEQLKSLLQQNNAEFIVVTISEISPRKLAMFPWVDVWIQSSCPRLSIDWGYAFEKPLLTPYETNVLFNTIAWQQPYPMDFYAKNSLGPWTPNHKPKQ